ncbi:MAG: hypothetical protein ACREBU_03260 [Nitrososphaera sp.]
MMGEQGKIKDIKETASDAVAIMRELGDPNVQESFGKIREVALIVKEITETMKTPEWLRNLDNIRAITENINSASTRMDDSVKTLKATGIIDDAKVLINTANRKVDSFRGPGGITSKDLHELAGTIREMLESISSLADELKATVAESGKRGVIRNVRDTIAQVDDTHRTIKQSTVD